MQSGDPVMNGMIIKSKYGDAIVNPLVSIVRKHAADVVRYAAEFGLTPAARSRISAGIHGDNSQSKFAGLLAG
jgi:P27 family predicted phage terminase small subunit